MVFAELYRITNGLDLLRKAGVEITHFPIEEIKQITESFNNP